MFVYRGISKKLYKKHGRRLIPKTNTPFEHQFSFDDHEKSPDWDSGATWDTTVTNAVLLHQLKQKGFPTSGISSTPHYERAVHYAVSKTRRLGFVFKIDTAQLAIHNVKTYTVRDHVKNPSVPADDEVILVVPEEKPLPPACIAKKLLVRYRRRK